MLAQAKSITTVCRRRGYASLFTAKRNAQDSDVVIVGGGPVGLALASALGSSSTVRESLSVTLVEASDLSKVLNWSLPAPSYSNRVSTITNVSQDFLKEIGAWDHIEESRTCPVEEMQVWDGISDARITFSASDLSTGTSQLSRLTENLNLQRALLRHISKIPEIKLLDKVRVDSIKNEEPEVNGWPLVHLSNGQTLRARLLVGADGFNSPVRIYAGVGSYGWAYDTHAIVATLNHPPRSSFQPPNTTAYQRILPTGPMAFLPISPTESSIVWCTKPALAAALKSVEPSVLAAMINAAYRLPEVSLRNLHSFILDRKQSGNPISLAQIQDEISWREKSHGINAYSPYSSSLSTATGVPSEGANLIPPIVTSIQPGTVASFPLRYNHADSYIGSGPGGRTVLVGDAAHTTHPFAGQGLNMGLADVQSLAQSIEAALLEGGDIGSRVSLLPYTRERYFENHKILAATDKMHKLYSFTAEPVVWIRSMGLEVVNELDTIKAAIMMSAGSGGNMMSSPGCVWNVVASGVEKVNETVHAATILGQTLSGMVGAGLQQIGTAFSRSER